MAYVYDGPYEKVCEECSTPFLSRHMKRRVCSAVCQRKQDQRTYLANKSGKYQGPYAKVCVACQREFSSRLPHQRTCSPACRRKYESGVYYENNVIQYRGVARGTVGALRELQVAMDLMARGWDVFRALSPSCPSDLVIMHNGTTLRVEVKTTPRRRDGDFGSLPSTGMRKSGRWDVFAAVAPDGEIKYVTPDNVAWSPKIPALA